MNTNRLVFSFIVIILFAACKDKPDAPAEGDEEKVEARC